MSAVATDAKPGRLLLDREAIRAAHADGATTTELANMFNCSQQAILKHLEKLGVKPNLPARLDPVTRLMAYIEKLDNGCWMWTGAQDGRGYGQIRLNGKRYRAHVVIFNLLKGPIPEGNVVDHQCHNRDPLCSGGRVCPHRHCVNPDHLEAVTATENTRRGFARITHCKRNHEFTPENTTVHLADGRRRCRTCERAHQREYQKSRPRRPYIRNRRRQPIRTQEEIQAERDRAKSDRIESVVMHLNAAGIPREWGRRRARSALQHLGIKAETGVWEEAIRRRKGEAA